MSELFRWYLARLRSDSKEKGEAANLTPLSLVDRDNARLQELIAKSGAARAERSEKILQAVRARHRGMLARVLTGPKLVEEYERAIATLLAALGDDVAEFDESDSQISLDSVAERVANALIQTREGERLIADYTSDLLCCVDDQFRFVDVNREFEITARYQKLSLLGASIERVLSVQDVGTFRTKCTDSRESGRPASFEAAISASDGEHVDLEWIAEWSASAQSYFCLARNISERRRRERLQNEIAAMLTHDLRIPISGVGLVLENIEGGVYGALSQSGKDKIAQARRSIVHMGHLLEQLLDAEKIASGQMPVELKPVQMRDVYQECLSIIEQNVSVKMPENSSATAYGDFRHITRILSNFLSNAIKASPEGAVIIVTEESEGGNSLRVTVTDAGPGVSPEVEPQLFERYKAEGHGLGLFIAKKLAELQRGNVGYIRLPQGSQFWLRLQIR